MVSDLRSLRHATTPRGTDCFPIQWDNQADPEKETYGAQ
jgi:hypothetical protein